VYEEVTCDVQPDPERYLTQGWLYAFANGEAGYPKDWTQLKSSNWHAFRDPNQEWEQTIYRNNANVVRQIQLNIDNAKLQKAFAAWNKQWTQVVARHVGAWMHAEHGLGIASLRSRAARCAHQHDQQRDRGQLDAQAALCARSRAL
jgi:propane monooxygenase small subunit